MSAATMTTTATTIELPADPSSPASARRFVAETLRHGRCPPETVDVALLLTSELVTNAVVHALTPLTLSVLVTAQRVRVAVDDAEGTIPEPGAEEALDTHGRGLTIVARLAQEWGVDRRDDGKSVWFELAESGA